MSHAATHFSCLDPSVRTAHQVLPEYPDPLRISWGVEDSIAQQHSMGNSIQHAASCPQAPSGKSLFYWSRLLYSSEILACWGILNIRGWEVWPHYDITPWQSSGKTHTLVRIQVVNRRLGASSWCAWYTWCNLPLLLVWTKADRSFRIQTVFNNTSQLINNPPSGVRSLLLKNCNQLGRRNANNPSTFSTKTPSLTVSKSCVSIIHDSMKSPVSY